MQRLFRIGAVLGVMVLAQPAAARSLPVVASFSILADVVREVGGTHVDVLSLVPAGGSPHGYEPTPRDAQAIKSADVVFVSGLGLEGWMDRLIKASATKAQPFVVSTGVAIIDRDSHGRRAADPHVWNAAANVVIWTRNIAKALAAADPDDADAFAANAERYAAQLQALDAQARARIEAIPQAKRKILTSHDALGYFGKAYGVTFLAPQGLSTEAEASAGEVAALIRQIKATGIKEYFLENSTDPRLVEQVARETGAKAGGTLYVEALSPPNGPAASYVALFQHNLDALVAAMSP